MIIDIMQAATLLGVLINVGVLVKHSNRTERRFTLLEVDMHYVKRKLNLPQHSNALDVN